MSKLEQRIRALILAEEAMIHELRLLYPIGATIRVILMRSQVTPSLGQVIGHDGGRYANIRVRLESRTRQVRVVAAKNIVR